MLVIEVELLTGRYAATSHDDRRRAEWPPHPARFFSALVAALHDRDPVDAGERAALLWLERQAPPSLEVDLDSAEHRDVHDVFVPVNDITVITGLSRLLSDVNAAREQLAAAEREPDAKVRAQATKGARKAIDRAERNLDKAALRPAESTVVDRDAAVALLPAHRTRQVRTFSVVVPAQTVFAFAWEASSPAADLRAALDALCARVTRLGHSSSLVRCAVVERAATVTLVPSDAGDRVLRVVGEGQLGRLEREFEHHRAMESRVLPAQPQRYAMSRAHSSERVATPSVFSDDWIVYQQCDGARLRSSRGPDLARVLRAALLEANGDASLPPSLSGHRADGSPTDVPHLAFVACPHVGFAYADGAVLGCAIVLPRSLSIEDRRTLMRLVAGWERERSRDGIVELGGADLPRIRLERVDLSEKRALQPERWCATSTRFVTATPIALDRHPGNLGGRRHRKAVIEAQQSVADACERIGLPRPIEVEISLMPFLQGAQPVREFPPWPPKSDKHSRARVHARVEFGEQIRGPVLLGAGRFFGLGLCVPIGADRSAFR